MTTPDSSSRSPKTPPVAHIIGGAKVSSSTDVDNPLYEQVERLFDLRISSSGADITIKLGGEQMTVKYEAFLALRESIEALLAQQTVAARIDEINNLVIAQGNYPEDRSYGHGAFHHVPVTEVQDRLQSLQTPPQKGNEQ